MTEGLEAVRNNIENEVGTLHNQHEINTDDHSDYSGGKPGQQTLQIFQQRLKTFLESGGQCSILLKLSL
jgi:hypothetical protein